MQTLVAWEVIIEWKTKVECATLQEQRCKYGIMLIRWLHYERHMSCPFGLIECIAALLLFFFNCCYFTIIKEPRSTKTYSRICALIWPYLRFSLVKLQGFVCKVTGGKHSWQPHQPGPMSNKFGMITERVSRRRIHLGTRSRPRRRRE